MAGSVGVGASFAHPSKQDSFRASGWRLTSGPTTSTAVGTTVDAQGLRPPTLEHFAAGGERLLEPAESRSPRVPARFPVARDAPHRSSPRRSW